MSGSTAGIHHITAIASDPSHNLRFYTSVLGLRLVKRTVNFDDPGTYHFYFGDAAGTPGSILTFFPWPGVPRGRSGNGQVSSIAFAAPPASMAFWRTHLERHDVATRDGDERFGEPVLQFADPDGLPIEIIQTGAARAGGVWPGAAIPADHALCGFHSATLAEEGYERTAHVLSDQLGFRTAGAEGNRFRYVAADTAHAGTIIDVLCAPDGARGRQGAGTVHHIAWRAADGTHQDAFRRDLVMAGLNVTPVMDRVYFQSIYFREPGGILFEIATDPPGFALDETFDHLGEGLKLPPWLERHRGEIEAALPPLT
jgi:glyoxalase family protein